MTDRNARPRCPARQPRRSGSGWTIRRPTTRSATGHTWLLVTDVDETLLGNDVALVRFVDQLAAAGNLRLAVNSSRPLHSVRRSLERAVVPVRPDALIGAMGTEIEIAGRLERSWRARHRTWDRSPVDRLMAAGGFAPHAEEFQTPLKASFSVPRSRWPDVESELTANSIEALVIGSGDSDLDILPPGAGKGPATRWVAELLGVPTNRLVVAGDSANDLDMFRAASRGIVVGNARAELLSRAPHTAYRARADRAGGLLEGLVHFGALAPSHPPRQPNGAIRP